MNIIVTGAAGFVGRHLVAALLSREHQVTAVDIDVERAKTMPWFEQCRFVSFNTHQPISSPREVLGDAAVVIHLAWQGLPNYKSLFHFEENLPADYRFLKSLIQDGYPQLLVAGTCLEYGNRNGRLSERMTTRPSTPYALAKDTLRKFLELLRTESPFTLKWARLFYMYGEGQNPNSLLAQLDKAIEGHMHTFNMSGGEQLRDYLPIQQVVNYLAMIAENQEFSGIVNVCSGQPISVRGLVEKHLAQRGKTIHLNFGYYPYLDYEPMAFWGDPSRLHSLVDK